MRIIEKIRHTLLKRRFKPIRIFCFHQVSDSFDDTYMQLIDWMSVDSLKRFVLDMQKEGYKFISLQEAKDKIMKDRYRVCKYAVLTADDGWASLRNVLPWLNEQQIPVTLFLNPAYLDGKHYRDSDKEQYLSAEEVALMYKHYPLVTVGSHGWEHVVALEQTEDDYKESIQRTQDYLSKLPNYIPYHAYTWGKYNAKTNRILVEAGMMPVYMDGRKNYNDFTVIHRELIDR